MPQRQGRGKTLRNILKGLHLTRRRRNRGSVLPVDTSPVENITFEPEVDASYEYVPPGHGNDDSDSNDERPEAIEIEFDDSPVSSDEFLTADIVGIQDQCCIPGVYTNCRVCQEEPNKLVPLQNRDKPRGGNRRRKTKRYVRRNKSKRTIKKMDKKLRK